MGFLEDRYADDASRWYENSSEIIIKKKRVSTGDCRDRLNDREYLLRRALNSEDHLNILVDAERESIKKNGMNARGIGLVNRLAILAGVSEKEIRELVKLEAEFDEHFNHERSVGEIKVVST